MKSTRWRLPEPPLRHRIALAAAVGVAGVWALGAALGPGLQAGAWYPARAVAGFTALMAVAVGVAGAQHPFARLGGANRVTLFRAMLVALMAAALAEPVTRSTAWQMVTATALLTGLDGLDGFLARRSAMRSHFGAWFDMETDALLVLVLSAFVWHGGKAGAWVLACGLMRYLFVAAGWVLPWMAGPLSATLRGKTVAVVQFVGLGVALAPSVTPPFSGAVAAATLATLAWSFALDVGRLWRQRPVTGDLR